MGLMKIGEFAKQLGVSVQTLRIMDKAGTLKPAVVSKSGTRYYSDEQLRQYVHQNEPERPVIGYCRVSTRSQKDDLETQIQNVKTYMIAKGYSFDIISDIGSGLDYERKGLKDLIQRINDRQVSRVVLLYKDRLMRFGFEMFSWFCELNDVQVEIIDHSAISKEEELTEDLIQIITVFADRLYGKRSKKTKKLIAEIRNDGGNENDSSREDSPASDN